VSTSESLSRAALIDLVENRYFGNVVRERLDAVLACLPELAAGQALAINVAVQRLREARLLGRNTPSTRFFAALSERLELRPAGKPSQVLLRR
jgi:hypothetical protein